VCLGGGIWGGAIRQTDAKPPTSKSKSHFTLILHTSQDKQNPVSTHCRFSLPVEHVLNQPPKSTNQSIHQSHLYSVVVTVQPTKSTNQPNQPINQSIIRLYIYSFVLTVELLSPVEHFLNVLLHDARNVGQVLRQLICVCGY
jgi:hypothetical protein